MDEPAVIVLLNKYNVLPITLSTNCNKSCDWKLSGRGGAAKQAKFPCAKCAIKSGVLHSKTQDKHICHNCIELGVNNHRCICHHIPMCTEDHIENLQSEVETFTASMPEITAEIYHIHSQCMLRSDDNPRCPSAFTETEISSIHYCTTCIECHNHRLWKRWCSKASKISLCKMCNKIWSSVLQDSGQAHLSYLH